MAGNRRHAGGMKSAMQNLRKIDEQIAQERQAEQEVTYRCGTCDKPITTGCYCSEECANADE